MNKKIKNFLDAVCIHIKYKAIHKDIRDEIISHIYELKYEYEKEGNNEERALDMAISAMGNCDDIGKRLNKQHKPKTEWSLIGLTVIIATIGIIIMFTSSKFETIQSVIFEKYLIFSIVGIGVLVGLYFFDYTKLKKITLPIYIVSILMLLFTIFKGARINGRSFLTIGDISISSDYVTILFLAAIAGFIEKNRGKGGVALARILILAFITLLVVMALPNFSLAIILTICYAVLIISSVIKNHYGGNRKIQLTSLVGIAVLGILFFTLHIITKQYRIKRIISFLTRGKSDPSGGGWIQIMADKWLAASNWFGKTTETVNGYHIYNGMPGITTDYVLINIIATLGWIVGITLILVIAVFITRMFTTTKKIKNDYGFYLSLGASTLLSVQYIISVLVNFSLFPLMSVSLPFISYGGTGYIVSMALVGIILSIWRRNNIVVASPKTMARNTNKFIKFEDGKLIIKFK